jgi:hypothetical protein
MIDALRNRFTNWKANPRKWQITYILSRLKTSSVSLLSRYRLAKNREKLLSPGIEAK